MDNSSEIVLPPGVPEEARELLIDIGYFAPDSLKLGDQITPIVLPMLDGSSDVTIGSNIRPTVLIFGSYT